MSDVTFRYARTLPIERSRAFLMFTDPRHIDASSSPPGGSFESLSFDLLASGRHHYRSRDADARDSWGLRVFTAIEPGRSLTWQQSFSDASGAVARHPMAPAFPLVVRSTLTFDDAPGAPGSTTLSLTWEPDGGSEAERAFFASIHDGMRAGWDAIFIQFERYAIAMTAATPSPRVRTCLWFDGNADEAAELYVSLLPGSAVDRVHRPAPGAPAFMVEFTLAGAPFMLLNGGPHYKLSPAASISVSTRGQDETDRLWAALVEGGGHEGQCGWLVDRFGVSWQIVPDALPRLLGAPDRSAAGRVQAAMMGMRKLVIAGLEAAYRGDATA